jgi:UDP-N-acetylmuramate dehydrogenase
LPVLLGKLAASGLSGLEGLAGIPGSVGGAIAGNAGSFGHAMGDALESVTVYTPDGGRHTAAREQLEPGYRHMGFSATGRPSPASWLMVVSAILRLKRTRPESIRAAMRGHMARKKSTQPVREKSAGCVFKNPDPALPAGKLLDEAGFRGKRLGGMLFSRLHANFLVNDGSGSADAAFDLIDMAREAVRERRGIALELEAKIWR